MLAPFIALALVLAPQQERANTPGAAVGSFLDAFRTLDERKFDEHFASDVTMFFPDGPFPEGRVEGRDAVLAAFHSFFKLAKERGRTSLQVIPLEQRVQQHGDVAIVTFRLDQDGAVGRRSFVMRKIGDEWLIAHFHASTIDPSAR